MNKVDALIAIPGKFNSMLCFRYIFLAAIAWIWIHKANYSKMLIGSLAVLSLCYLYFVMENNNVKPFIHPSNWLSQNYPVYFWTYILIQLLWHSYGVIRCEAIRQAFCWLGRNSWEIFVMQMFVLGFIKLDDCALFSNQAVNQLLFVLTGFVLSLFPVIVYRILKSRLCVQK